MLSLGPLAFTAPWLLAALAVLPALWLLLKVVPPAPRRLVFPAMRLLAGLGGGEHAPHRTPLWLVILRLALGALLILGLAHPVLHPAAALPGDGPLLVVVDNGWASAADWASRKERLDGLLAAADRAHRPVLLLPTAPPVSMSRLGPAAEARASAQGLVPRPWGTDRQAALAALEAPPLEVPLEAPAATHLPHPLTAVWLSDGLAGEGAAALEAALGRLGTLTVLTPAPTALPHLLMPPAADNADLTAEIGRLPDGPAERRWVKALGDDGALLGREAASFARGSTRAQAKLAMPAEIRNRVSRIEIEGEESAGAVVLLDGRWQRRPVGLVSGDPAQADQPLLGDLYYLERALSPTAELRRGRIADLVSRNLSALLLSDIGTLAPDDAARLARWVGEGGVLIRFAGPKLAQKLSPAGDGLLPVQLRGGGRAMGGAMSWTHPMALAPFPENSPFHGLAIPPDVRIKSQVLAEPSMDTETKSWAQLEDGTPLVTAAPRGRGWVILIHTSAGPSWSNLPLSGLFVEMLRRMVALGPGVAPAEAGDEMLAPQAVLDGFGHFQTPSAGVLGLPAKALAATTPDPVHPPGFYGAADSRHALNLSPSVSALLPLAPAARTGGYGLDQEVDLQFWFLAAALALAFIDSVIGLGLRGLLPLSAAFLLLVAVPVPAAAAPPVTAAASPPVSASAASPPVSASAASPPVSASASSPPVSASASVDIHFGYVRTGDAEIDRVSRAGLTGLGLALHQRTAVEPAEPMAIDLERDPLLFFPVIYWPVTPNQPALSPQAAHKLTEYLGKGGMVLFDTRDEGTGKASARLRTLLQGVDLPPLAPMAPDHVLTRSFYLLHGAPGRWVGGQVWIEQAGGSPDDPVSPVVVGGNDWAAAWAVDGAGQAMFAVVPGGEEQREAALRFGINLVMYALNGTYKADQVHLPAIMERLGQ